MDQRLQAFERLLTIMDELRAKCPWDQKQTMQTLRHLTIEEVYEPFLIQEGFLTRTPRGRQLTDLTYKHLGRRYRLTDVAGKVISGLMA